MDKPKDACGDGDMADLRRRAERRLREWKSSGKVPATQPELARLLHELEVQHIELELQNSELRSARLALEHGLARYTELFDFAPIGYASLAADGTMRDVNHAGAGLLQRARATLIGQPFALQLAPRDRAAFHALFQNALLSETHDMRVLSLAGPAPVRYVSVAARLVTQAEPAVLLTFEDVTEQRSREQKLLATESALREADRRKDDFLALLSHELRNPLAPICSALYVLDGAAPASPQARKAQQVIERQVSHLTHLVDDLLDVTRITRGKVELRRAPVELTELLQRALEDHRASFEARGIKLVTELASGPLWLDADATRLVQSISNVLVNTEKFTPRGGVVTVSVAHQDGYAILRVRDTGRGIAPEVLPRLFEPFAQAPQTLERAQGGLGLGLSMVKGFVELHGGHVEIESPGLGRGTSLTISLPLMAEVPHAEYAPAQAPKGSARKVLVIEDNVDAADTLMDALSLSGHDVRVAYDGATGLRVAREFHPQVVICDIGLPGMDGYAVARAFQSESDVRDARLIALTGYAQPQDLERAKAAGFCRHVSKPPSLEQLNRILGEVKVANAQ